MNARSPICLTLFLCLALPVVASSQDTQLPTRQEALSSRYSRFEKLLLQMAEYLGRTDPDRAELLMRALSRSRENRISNQMEGIVELLRDEDFNEAVEGQDLLVQNLRALLELLQSEDRRSELEEEEARIRELLKDVNQLIGDQKIARAQVARAGKPADGAKAQQRVAEKTDRVVERVRGQDEERSTGDPPQGDQPQDGKPQDGKPQDGKPQDGKPQDGKPQDGEPEQEKTPGRKELEEARDAMQRAIEKIKQDQKQGSAEEQDRALEKLLAAKEELEEKLRQLREEERELMLAALEARFQKMLAMQLLINSGTSTLAAADKEKWLDSDYTRARQLAQQERDVELEASKALTVLREEGTSVSFPMAVEDVREDILTVARRLDEARADMLTQEIQADIVEALREMVLALQKEMEKSDDQQGQQQQGTPQNAQGDPVLVDLIAELKMLRTLQKRINRRTRQIGRELDGDQADNADLLEQLRQLAERQERIRQTAIDIARTREEN